MYSKYIVFYLFLYIVNSNAQITELSDGVIKSTDVKPSEKKRIIKCCPRKGYLDQRNLCVRNTAVGSMTDDFSDVPVYDKHAKLTDKNVSDGFNLVAGKDLNFSRHLALYFGPQFNYYLTEDGNLLVELPNAYNRWTTFDHTHFCLDHALTLENNSTKLETRFKAVYDVTQSQPNVLFNTCAQLISCFFLALVLAVYCLLPELRNDVGVGLILMAFIVSQLGAFLMLSTLQLIMLNGNSTKAICLGFSYTIYFLLLASFFWMNVISFDIWITMFRLARSYRLHRSKSSTMYPYILYAWGVPLLMTIALAVLNSVDLRHMPWIITPRIDEYNCFLDGGEKLVYLYCPMLILLTFNWILFLATCLQIYKIRKATYNQTSVTLYLKLSCVMGITWVLEVASFFYPDLSVWYISDAYNLLIGLVLFLIFVCKRKILRMLLVRFGVNSHINRDEDCNGIGLEERTPTRIRQ